MPVSPEMPFRGEREEAERLGALFTEREVLESMSVDQLVDFVLDKGEKVSEIERIMNLAADVLEANGTDMRQELEKREKKNGEEN